MIKLRTKEDKPIHFIITFIHMMHVKRINELIQSIAVSLFAGDIEGFNLGAVFGLGRSRGLKLILDGYDYVKYRTKRNVSSWRCSLYHKGSMCCKARAITKNVDGKSIAKVIPNIKHNHPKLKLN